jgi:hypothetical protein
MNYYTLKELAIMIGMLVKIDGTEAIIERLHHLINEQCEMKVAEHKLMEREIEVLKKRLEAEISKQDEKVAARYPEFPSAGEPVECCGRCCHDNQ